MIEVIRRGGMEAGTVQETTSVIANNDGPKRGPAQARSRAPGAPYTIDQAAAALNLSPRTVRHRILVGLLVAYKDGHLWRIPERAVADYLANLEGYRPPPIGTGTAVRRHLR